MVKRKRVKRESLFKLPQQLGLIDYGKIFASLDKAKNLFTFWGLLYAAQYPSKTLPFKFYHMITTAAAYKQLDNSVTGLQAQGYIAGELANYLIQISYDNAVGGGTDEGGSNGPPPAPPIDPDAPNYGNMPPTRTETGNLPPAYPTGEGATPPFSGYYTQWGIPIRAPPAPGQGSAR